MERIFQPSKWFVIFCGLLVLVWLALQFVSHWRLANEAKEQAVAIFTWDWLPRGWRSQAEATEVNVVRRTATDAIVKVKGEQRLSLAISSMPGASVGKLERDDMSVTLTFYRANKNWILGKVELP